MHTIIVIPGLGDEDAVKKIRWIVKRWSTPNRKVQIFQSQWETKESAEKKLHRLKVFLERHSSERVSIVAYSAGGALAMRLLKEHPSIERFVLISSKLKGAEKIGENYQNRAPALLGTVQASQSIIDGITDTEIQKIICLRPFFDNVVPIEDMSFEGVITKRIPMILHAPSIVLALIFQVSRLIK